GAGNLPTAEYLPVHRIIPSEQAMTGPHGQFDHVGNNRAMSDIKRRWASLGPHIIDIGNTRPLAGGAEERRCVVHRLTERVGALKENATLPLVSRGEHHGVVVRVSVVHTCHDRSDEWVGKYLLIRDLTAAEGRIAHDDARLVQIQKRSQLMTG